MEWSEKFLSLEARKILILFLPILFVFIYIGAGCAGETRPLGCRNLDMISKFVLYPIYLSVSLIPFPHISVIIGLLAYYITGCLIYCGYDKLKEKLTKKKMWYVWFVGYF